MKHIIIIGSRSVGKTTIGRILAKHLRLKYLDFDEYVEKELNGIDKYVAEYGVESYRIEEKKLLKKFIKNLKDKCVFSVGGGTIASQFLDVSKRNSALVKKIGDIVYITPYADDTKSILKLYSNEVKRKGRKSLDEIKKLYFLRKPIYEKSYDLKVFLEGKSRKTIVKEIATSLVLLKD